MRTVVRCLALCLLLCASGLASAEAPAIARADQALHTGHLRQAQALLAEIMQQHPGSARGHFLQAQLDARSHQFEAARAAMGRAEQLAPDLPFATPTEVEKLRTAIAGVAPGNPRHNREKLALALAAAVAVVWLLRRYAVPLASVSRAAAQDAAPGGSADLRARAGNGPAGSFKSES